MSMNILPVFWYEDEHGNRFEPCHGFEYDYPGYPYQHCRFPNMLTHEIVALGEEGKPTIVRGHSTFSTDLVDAIVRSGVYNSYNAILLAGVACERCMNALAYNFGLPWGYAWQSVEWQQARTECELCVPRYGTAVYYPQFTEVKKPSKWFLFKSRLRRKFRRR